MKKPLPRWIKSGMNRRKTPKTLAVPEADSTQAEAHAFLRQYLELSLQMMAQHGKFQRPGGYWNLHDFVLQNGQPFDPAPLPDDVRYGKVKQCYTNAFNVMLEDPDRFVYVEGVGVAFIPCDHAWVWDRQHQQTVDPTWRNDGDRPPVAYLGIPLKHTYVTRAVLKKQTYGVFDDWENHFPILTADKADWLETEL